MPARMVSLEFGKWKTLVVDAGYDKCTVPIYYSSARGETIPLLKTLLSNRCRFNCRYCGLKIRKPSEWVKWPVDKLARVTWTLWIKGKVKGLFLSSSVDGESDEVVMEEIEVARLLREMGYTGYIHLRLMPGTSRDLIREAVKVADRVGVNLEAPSSEVLGDIAPSKNWEKDLFSCLKAIVEEARKAYTEREKPYGYSRAGVDTQFVLHPVCYTTDFDYIKLTWKLYRELGLRRVYYSGFTPIKGTPLQENPACPGWRVKRIYQVSFLIRDYGFSLDEVKLILDSNGNLPDEDPKVCFARKSNIFPVDLNNASLSELLKVPGIGPRTALRIVKLRESKGKLEIDDLRRLIGRKRTRKISRYVVF